MHYRLDYRSRLPVFIMALFVCRINQQLKLVVALSIVIIFFIVTTILVPINSDGWQYSFFALTMVIVVTLNGASATPLFTHRC